MIPESSAITSRAKQHGDACGLGVLRCMTLEEEAVGIGAGDTGQLRLLLNYYYGPRWGAVTEKAVGTFYGRAKVWSERMGDVFLALSHRFLPTSMHFSTPHSAAPTGLFRLSEAYPGISSWATFRRPFGTHSGAFGFSRRLCRPTLIP